MLIRRNINPRSNHCRRGITGVELVAAIGATAVSLSILTIAIDDAEDNVKVTKSMMNLKNHGIAHATYAAEWNGRQWTTSPNDLAVLLGKNEFPDKYPTEGKLGEDHVASVPLGFDRNGKYHVTRKAWAIQPFWAGERSDLGSFRTYNTKPFNMYMNGKVFDGIFIADKDATISPRFTQHSRDPGEWPTEATKLYMPSYCTSAAAMVSPKVFAGDNKGVGSGSLPAAFRSPNLSAARYPDLKTHMLEHGWLQNSPESKTMPGTQLGWVYNLGTASEPATLFYDGHVKLLSVIRIIESNKRVTAQGDAPLWIDDPGIYGKGYYENYTTDPENSTSFHVFTRDGIFGRDSVDNDDVDAQAAEHQHDITMPEERPLEGEGRGLLID